MTPADPPRTTPAHRRAIRRRRFTAALLALAALVPAALVAQQVAPRVVSRISRLLPERMGDPQGAEVTRLTLRSRAARSNRQITVVVPPGPAPERPRPLLVFLHGRGGTDRSQLDTPMFTALRKLGRDAPVIAFPDGGNSSYWHDRSSGDWGRYVDEEVISFVTRRFGTDPRRVAIGGISMGGFGALDIAISQPGRFCAVGAHSPAIWQTGGETAPGAFDDSEDFAAHDLVAVAHDDPQAFAAQPLRIDAGDADPFLPGDRALVADLRAGDVPVTFHTPPGGHTGDYWNDHWKDYLPYYATALRDCRREHAIRAAAKP